MNESISQIPCVFSAVVLVVLCVSVVAATDNKSNQTGDSTASGVRSNSSFDQTALLNDIEFACRDLIYPDSACISALDTFFLSDLATAPISESPRYVPEDYRVAPQMVFSDVLDRHEKVIGALSRSECRLEEGPIRFDLGESCSAKAMIETGKFISECAQIATFGRIALVLERKQQQELEERSSVNSSEYAQRRDELRTERFRTIWVRAKCRAYTNDHYVELVDLIPQLKRQQRAAYCRKLLYSGTDKEAEGPESRLGWIGGLGVDDRDGEQFSLRNQTAGFLKRYSVWLGALDSLEGPVAGLAFDEEAMESLFRVSPTLAYHQTLFVTHDLEERVRVAVNIRIASLRERLDIAPDHLWERVCEDRRECKSTLAKIDLAEWHDEDSIEVLREFETVARQMERERESDDQQIVASRSHPHRTTGIKLPDPMEVLEEYDRHRSHPDSPLAAFDECMRAGDTTESQDGE